MNNPLPFGQHGGLTAMVRYVEQADIIRRAIGPSFVQRSRVEALWRRIFAPAVQLHNDRSGKTTRSTTPMDTDTEQ